MAGLTIARLVEAVLPVAVRCEDGHLVPATLQPNGSIDDQALGAANAQVGVEEHNVLFFARHNLFVSANSRQRVATGAMVGQKPPCRFGASARATLLK